MVLVTPTYTKSSKNSKIVKLCIIFVVEIFGLKKTMRAQKIKFDKFCELMINKAVKYIHITPHAGINKIYLYKR